MALMGCFVANCGRRRTQRSEPNGRAFPLACYAGRSMLGMGPRSTLSSSRSCIEHCRARPLHESCLCFSRYEDSQNSVPDMVRAFQDESHCQRSLEAVAWPSRRLCPACGHRRSIALTGRENGSEHDLGSTSAWTAAAAFRSRSRPARPCMQPAPVAGVALRPLADAAIR
jgi:hypothetical protein